MTGLFKTAVVVLGVLIATYIVLHLVNFALHLISLLFPLALVALIAYVFYKLISSKSSTGTHRIFH